MKTISGIVILWAFCLFSAPAFSQTVSMTFLPNPSKTVINRHIYGHFSEHLGRCIYDGFWVADSMKVPKKDRIRLDVVEALKKINIPIIKNIVKRELFRYKYPIISKVLSKVRSTLKS